MPEILPEQEARQGAKGKPALYVLLASLALLAVAITGLMMWQATNSPNSYQSKGQAGARSDATGSVNAGINASSSNSSNVPAANPNYPSPAQPTANPNPK